MAGGSSSTDLDVVENKEMSASTANLLKGIRLPPLPTDRDAEDGLLPVPDKKASSGWGFKLFKTANPVSPSPSTTVEPSYTPRPPISPQSSSVRDDSGAADASTDAPEWSAPPSPWGNVNPTVRSPKGEKGQGRTFGGFFRRDAKEKDLPVAPTDGTGLEPSPHFDEQHVTRQSGEWDDGKRSVEAKEVLPAAEVDEEARHLYVTDEREKRSELPPEQVNDSQTAS